MKLKPEQYINRELSWLAFNTRVLEEAQDARNPLLERVKFLAITASNLDEFFMVRVGGLRMLADRGILKPDEAGKSARQLLTDISRETHRMVEAQYACLSKQLEPELERNGIRRIRANRLTGEDLRHLSQVFDADVFPVLTPRLVRPEEEEFPALAGLTLHLALRLRDPEGLEHRAVVAIPRRLPRFFALPGGEGAGHLAAEDMVSLHAERLFPGCAVLEHAVFRVTRNADMTVVEDLASDLMTRMQEVLVARRRSDVVRLELDTGTPSATRQWLQRLLDIGDRDTYRCPGPLMLSGWMALAELPGYEELRYESQPPHPSPSIRPGESMFENIARGDIVLYHPYEQYDPVVRFLREAATDPDVLAIKQTLYRTSRKSPIIDALARAAVAGKQVTALVELKARFDEARNIEWAQTLEEAGVQIIYGIRNLKTHAKVCLVVRREPGGIRRYVHFGTGNYNEQTARIYSDISFFSAQEDYGADASQFFNTITGITQPVAYRRIEAAPLGLRARLVSLIRAEAERSRHGQESRILIKTNSLSDPGLIAELYEASKAGVRIDLLVRGICGLRPGLPGLSESIRVFSVIDRYLEHARIFYFHQGGEGRLFISSADWMLRNLDKRIELMAEIHDRSCRRRLLQFLRLHLQDNVKARRLLPDGSYERVVPLPRQRAIRSQYALYRMARTAARAASDSRAVRFIPHRPAE